MRSQGAALICLGRAAFASLALSTDLFAQDERQLRHHANRGLPSRCSNLYRALRLAGHSAGCEKSSSFIPKLEAEC